MHTSLICYVDRNNLLAYMLIPYFEAGLNFKLAQVESFTCGL